MWVGDFPIDSLNIVCASVVIDFYGIPILMWIFNALDLSKLNKNWCQSIANCSGYKNMQIRNHIDQNELSYQRFADPIDPDGCRDNITHTQK